MVIIQPFDDEHVIVGQGTVGMEIVRQQREPFDAIFVEVGGGLIAGISAYIKTQWPQTRVVGVEPHDTPTLHAALAAGERVVLEHVGIFADGVAVKQIRAVPFRIARECVDEVVLVTTDEICAAIKDIFEDTRSIADPRGRGQGGGPEALRRARGRGRPAVRDHRERRERELRPSAPHRRAGRARPLPDVSRRGGVRAPGGDGESGVPVVLAVSGCRARSAASPGAQAIGWLPSSARRSCVATERNISAKCLRQRRRG